MNYADPTLWDYLWSTNSPEQLHTLMRKQAAPTDDANRIVYVARIAHVLIGLDKNADARDMLEDALEQYEGRPGLDVAMLRAVRYIALYYLGELDEILRTPPLIQGLAPLRIEAAVLTHYTYAAALSGRGKLQAAIVSMARAEGLAGQLGLQHRSKVLRLSLANFRQQVGEMLDPQEILADVDSRHEATAAWGTAVAVSAMLKRGEYRRAHSQAMAQKLNDTCLMAALAGVAPHPSEQGNDAWSLQVADAIRMAEQGRYDDMPVLEPHRDLRVAQYGPILNGLRTLRAYRQFSSVDAELGAPPMGLEQRVLWSMVRFAAVLDGQATGNLVVIAESILADLANLPYPADVIHLMERLLPGQTLLLNYCPGAATVPGLGALRTPILIGDTVRGPTRIEIHGPSADTLIAKALGEKIVINSGATSKTRTKLRGYGIDMDQMVTIGHMYLWLSQIARSAEGTSRAQAWRQALQSCTASSLRLRQVLAGQIRAD